MLARHFTDNRGNLYEGTLSDFHPALVRSFEMQSNESPNDRSDLAGVIGALGASDAELPAALGSRVDLDAFRTYDRGTLELTHASTEPGGRVCGTFEANAYTFTGASGRRSARPAAVAAVRGPRAAAPTSAR